VENRAELKGVVEDGVFCPKIYLDGTETHLGPFQPRPIPVATMGDVFNTMHLLDKIPDLWVGRTWKIAHLNLVGLMVPGRTVTTSIMIAEVGEDELEWQNQKVSCFRIDYREPGKKVTAHTWVRRRDGLVLCQQVGEDYLDWVMVREVHK
jgi:hypothetical protein